MNIRDPNRNEGGIFDLIQIGRFRVLLETLLAVADSNAGNLLRTVNDFFPATIVGTQGMPANLRLNVSAPEEIVHELRQEGVIGQRLTELIECLTAITHQDYRSAILGQRPQEQELQEIEILSLVYGHVLRHAVNFALGLKGDLRVVKAHQRVRGHRNAVIRTTFGHVGERAEAGIAHHVFANQLLCLLEMTACAEVIQDEGLVVLVCIASQGVQQQFVAVSINHGRVKGQADRFTTLLCLIVLRPRARILEVVGYPAHMRLQLLQRVHCTLMDRAEADVLGR
ncbi:hypothetical protein D3C78_1093210 [compost metagenome]